MKEVFVDRSITYLIKNNACSKEQVNTFRYVLESLYSLVSKTGVVLIISIFLNTFKITFISLLLFSVLRGFTFGIHASKNTYCWITTIGVYSIFPFLIQRIPFSEVFIIICYLMGFLSILFFSPSDTPKRPLINKRKRKVNKIISLGIGMIYMLLSFFINTDYFYKIVCFVLLLTTICINPLTYKFFKIPYNNYKNYYN